MSNQERDDNLDARLAEEARIICRMNTVLPTIEDVADEAWNEDDSRARFFEVFFADTPIAPLLPTLASTDSDFLESSRQNLSIFGTSGHVYVRVRRDRDEAEYNLAEMLVTSDQGVWRTEASLVDRAQAAILLEPWDEASDEAFPALLDLGTETELAHTLQTARNSLALQSEDEIRVWIGLRLIDSTETPSTPGDDRG